MPLRGNAQQRNVITREVPQAATYQDMRLNPVYRADIIVEGEAIPEIESAERILPVRLSVSKSD